MTQRASESLVAALIRIGLLLALVIMLMAENAQAQPLPVLGAGSHPSRTGNPTSLQPQIPCCRHSNSPDGVAVVAPASTSKETV